MDRRIVAMAGFMILGLSPSFVDWIQEPERRASMVGFYAAGIALIWWGLWDGE